MSNQLPEGWNIHLFSDFCTATNERCGERNLEPLSVSKVLGIVPQSQKFKKRVASKNIERYKVLNRGEFAYDPMLLWDGSINQLTSIAQGVVSPAYYTFKVDPKKIFPKYFLYVLKSDYLLSFYQMISKGTNKRRQKAELKDFLSGEFQFPSLPEQKKIAVILKSVDETIEKTNAQIEKLKNLKAGMMFELLTKGLGHAEFKDSPLGRIPESWSFTELWKVLISIDSGWSPSCEERAPGTGEWGVLKVSAVTRGEFIEQESKVLPKDLSPREKARVRKGDILLTRANGAADLVGKCVIVNKEPQAKLMMSDKILRLKPTEDIFNEFLLHVFNSHLIRKQIEFCWGGSSGQKNISQSDIRNFIIPLPSVAEQKTISKSITHIDHLLRCKKQKLQALINSKKALMQDLLTGKVRVKADQKESAVA